MPDCRRVPPRLPACACPPACAASESTLLALLWLLESFHDSRRSAATTCLGAYLKYLALFSPQVRAAQHRQPVCGLAWLWLTSGSCLPLSGAPAAASLP